jgi:hypothetical protein
LCNAHFALCNTGVDIEIVLLLKKVFHDADHPLSCRQSFYGFLGCAAKVELPEGLSRHHWKHCRCKRARKYAVAYFVKPKWMEVGARWQKQFRERADGRRSRHDRKFLQQMSPPQLSMVMNDKCRDLRRFHANSTPRSLQVLQQLTNSRQHPYRRNTFTDNPLRTSMPSLCFALACHNQRSHRDFDAFQNRTRNAWECPLDLFL